MSSTAGDDVAGEGPALVCGRLQPVTRSEEQQQQVGEGPTGSNPGLTLLKSGGFIYGAHVGTPVVQGPLIRHFSKGLNLFIASVIYL